MASFKLIKAQHDAAEAFARETLNQLLRDPAYSNPTSQYPYGQNDNLLRGSVGSGKTAVSGTGIKNVYEALSSTSNRPDVVTFFMSTSEGGLINQSREKYEALGLTTVSVDDFLRDGFVDGTVVFLPLQSVYSGKNTRRGYGEYETLDSMFERRGNTKIILIFDEAHNNLEGKKAESTQNTIHMIHPDVLWAMTATPRRNEKDYAGVRVNIDLRGCIDEDIVVENLFVNSIGDAANTTSVKGCITNAIDTQRILERAFKLAPFTKDIVPLTCIQISNDKGSTTTDSADDIKQAERVRQALIALNVPPEQIAVCLAKDKNIGGVKNDNVINDIKYSHDVRYLIFKIAAATGWDCTRARQLVRLRKTGTILDQQTIGRISRMPVARKSVRHTIVGSKDADVVSDSVRTVVPQDEIEKYGSPLDYLSHFLDNAFIITDDANYSVPDAFVQDRIVDKSRRYEPIVRQEFAALASASIPSFKVVTTTGFDNLYYRDKFMTWLSERLKTASEKYNYNPDALKIPYVHGHVLSELAVYDETNDIDERQIGWSEYNPNETDPLTIVRSQIANGRLGNSAIRANWESIEPILIGVIKRIANKRGVTSNDMMKLIMSNFSSQQHGAHIDGKIKFVENILINVMSDEDVVKEASKKIKQTTFSVDACERYSPKPLVEDAPKNYLDEKIEPWSNDKKLRRSNGSSYDAGFDAKSSAVWHSMPEIITFKSLAAHADDRVVKMFVKLPDGSSAFSYPYLRRIKSVASNRTHNELGEHRPDFLAIIGNKGYFIESKGGETESDGQYDNNDIDEYTYAKFAGACSFWNDGITDMDGRIVMSSEEFKRCFRNAYGVDFGGLVFTKTFTYGKGKKQTTDIRYLPARKVSDWNASLGTSEWMDEDEFFRRCAEE